MLRGVLDGGGEVLVTDWSQPPPLRGKVLREATSLVKQFDEWYQTYSDGWPDCQHVSTVVGEALQRRGYKVTVVGGDARASDSGEEGIHYWLLVDGKHFDPKQALLRLEDPAFRYSNYNGAWLWTVDEALNNAVETCPAL